MKKTRFLLGCSLICLTATGCSNYVRQGEQVDPPAASAQVSPADNEQTEMEVAVADEANPGYSATASGLKYRIVREGNDTKPTPASKVKVHYKGMLVNGKVFDSSYDRGQPAEFGLGQVIAGWTEGLQYMSVGEKSRLFIPSHLAYGDRSAGSIPGGSVLIFDVELIAVNN